MLFRETKLKGAFIIDLERIEDRRGFFARAWCRKEFAEHGMTSVIVQCNIAHNPRKGTLRGMHYQAEPHGEDKLVRCTNGAIYDVLLDLRRSSPTYGRWEGFELTRDNRRMLFVPKGVAHGYQTLVDDSEVFYQVSAEYMKDAERGVRWDDPAFKIAWPITPPSVISDKDAMFPDFSE